MGYLLKLLKPEQVSDRARGPARFVIEINGEPQKKFGILFPDTARGIAAGYPAHMTVAIRELTEREVMDYLMTGWGQGG